MAVLIEDGYVKKYEGYDKARRRRNFWQLSYDCYSPDYVRGVDGEGVDILRKHEREDDEDYRRRLETTTAITIVGPIARRYNSFVMRKEIIVDSDESTFGEMWDDIDGYGANVSDFMGARLLEAQINLDSFFLIDSTNESGTEKTKLQAMEDGDRITWNAVRADEVVQVRWYKGQIVEAAIVQWDRDGSPFVLWMDETDAQRIEVSVDTNTTGLIIKVIEEGEIYSHGYEGCPLIGLRLPFGDGVSQIGPIAELQKSIVRYRSLLDEEMFNATFTQKYLFGVHAEEVDADAKYGAKHALCIPSPQAHIESLGGDVSQADSIRRSITDDKDEAYRVAGISSDTGDGGPVESGIAKAFKFNDLAAILKALSKAAEAAQTRAENLTAKAMGLSDWQSCKYDDEFTMPIFEAELRQAIDVITSPLPATIKKNLIIRFKERNLELDDEETEKLTQELEDLGVLPGLLT